MKKIYYNAVIILMAVGLMACHPNNADKDVIMVNDSSGEDNNTEALLQTGQLESEKASSKSKQEDTKGTDCKTTVNGATKDSSTDDNSTARKSTNVKTSTGSSDNSSSVSSSEAKIQASNNISMGENKMATTDVKDTANFYGIEFAKDSSIFERIKGKSYKDNCTVPVEDLRYLHVLHVGFDGQSHEGEIVCNKFIAEDLLEIFEALYEAKYPIEKIRLVDEYGADDESSMADNNTSSFNFRFISHTTKVSKHGYGLAMDINTLYNPYVKTVNGQLSIEPANAVEYVDRSKDFEHKIDENDLAYQLFIAHGFEWGGAWKNSKDYQHFEVPDSVVKQLYK